MGAPQQSLLAAASEPLLAGLLAFFPLTADGNDVSGNGNDLVNHGATFGTLGATFAGAEYLDRASLLNGLSAGTISFWTNSNAANGMYALDAADLNYGFSLGESSGSDQVVSQATGSGVQFVIGNAASNTYRNLVFAYDGANVALYQDGVLVGSVGQSGSFATSYFAVGGWNYYSQFSVGEVGFVGVWGRALPAVEVAQVHNGGVPWVP